MVSLRQQAFMTTKDIELEDRIRAAQVRSAYSNTAPGMTATAVAGFLVAGILGGVGAVSWTVAIVFSVFMLIQIHARRFLLAAAVAAALRHAAAGDAVFLRGGQWGDHRLRRAAAGDLPVHPAHDVVSHGVDDRAGRLGALGAGAH